MSTFSKRKSPRASSSNHSIIASLFNAITPHRRCPRALLTVAAMPLWTRATSLARAATRTVAVVTNGDVHKSVQALNLSTPDPGSSDKTATRTVQPAPVYLPRPCRGMTNHTTPATIQDRRVATVMASGCRNHITITGHKAQPPASTANHAD